MGTLQSAALLLGLAALGGLTMFAIRLRGNNPPTWLALGHGVLALSGVGILGRLYQTTGLPSPANWSLIAFVAAIAGGLFLFVGFHLRGRLIPVPIVIGHGLIAATGFGLLLFSLYGRG